MIVVLRNPTYAKLFSAQVIALLGTGLLTVALGLLAYDLAGSDAGLVLGTALTIKMVAYVLVSPLMAALVTRLPRKTVLVTADAVRAAVALALPMVSETWHLYVLIFVLQAASATFTPAFQALIPDVLPDEDQYTRALSLSRLAYDLESLLSPVLAAALLAVTTFSTLFIGTVVGFVLSAVLVLATKLPAGRPTAPTPFLDRLMRGVRLFWRAPELRGLLAMNVVVAAAVAMVVVNSVVVVRGVLDGPDSDLALLLAAFGAGSMVVALTLPRALRRLSDRRLMLAGSAVMVVGLAAAAVVISLPQDAGTRVLVLSVWLVLGAGSSMVLTPSARLLRRASDADDRPAVFAAQFSLSHACYLVTYPVAGVLGVAVGLATTALVLGGVAALALVVAAVAWPRVPRPVAVDR